MYIYHTDPEIVKNSKGERENQGDEIKCLSRFWLFMFIDIQIKEILNSFSLYFLWVGRNA